MLVENVLDFVLHALVWDLLVEPMLFDCRGFLLGLVRLVVNLVASTATAKVIVIGLVRAYRSLRDDVPITNMPIGSGFSGYVTCAASSS